MYTRTAVDKCITPQKWFRLKILLLGGNSHCLHLVVGILLLFKNTFTYLGCYKKYEIVLFTKISVSREVVSSRFFIVSVSDFFVYF